MLRTKWLNNIRLPWSGRGKSIETTYKGICIHLSKTGGTSVRKALENEPGLITNLKQKWLGWKDDSTYASFAREGLCTYVRRHVGEIGWNNAFKFTFVRNPFDRAVSNWKYFCKLGTIDGTFEEYVELIATAPQGYPTGNLKLVALLWHAEPQWFHIVDKSGAQLVDFVGRFENLSADFEEICRQLEVRDARLPHLNETNHDHYRSYYSEHTKRLIALRYEKDIEKFGYCF